MTNDRSKEKATFFLLRALQALNKPEINWQMVGVDIGTAVGYMPPKAQKELKETLKAYTHEETDLDDDTDCHFCGAPPPCSCGTR